MEGVRQQDPTSDGWVLRVSGVDLIREAPLWLHLLVLILATARVIGFVTDDRIFRAPRQRFLRRVAPEFMNTPPGSECSPESYSGFLVTCAWCAGWWISLAAGLAWLTWPVGTTLIALPVALSFLAPLLSARYGPEEDPRPDVPIPPRRVS